MTDEQLERLIEVLLSIDVSLREISETLSNAAEWSKLDEEQ